MTLHRILATALLPAILAIGDAKAQPMGCPGDAEEWASFRDDAIGVALDQLRTVSGETFIDFSRFLALSASIRDVGERCLGLQEDNGVAVPAGLQPVLGNFYSFFGGLGLQTDQDHSFGMSIPDTDYVEAIGDVIELPSLLTSQEFLRAVSNRETYKLAFDMVRANNALLPPEQRWIPLIYKSRFLTTPDQSQTYGRFFVLVPGETDKWIQFGILPPEAPKTRVNNLSIVAVRRLPGHSEESPHTETFIVDYWRTYHDGQSRSGQDPVIEVRTKLESGQGSENCSECHKTPVLGIHPETVYTFDGGGGLVELPDDEAEAIPNLINSFIEDYGPPSFRGWQSPQQYGPAMGPAGAERSDDFLLSCTSGTGVSSESFGKLREAMGCAACHNDNLIGRINFPQATKTTREFALAHPETGALSPLVATYVLQGWMPPGFVMTEAERAALVRCLYQEFLDIKEKKGLLVDWLKGAE